ncbi:hypothetical protein FJZ36_14205 [Candidatus Poribacteria bacterium]|nr:hypothetical protein [Candidatus Poribacteria bacterium]
MPVFRSGKGSASSWCEMEFFEILRLDPGTTRVLERVGAKEKLIVAEGECRIRYGSTDIDATGYNNLDLADPGEQFRIDAHTTTVAVRMAGRWGDEVGGSGLFAGRNSDEPKDPGDKVGYPKRTNFDSHYHDCDEYWILIDGSGVAVSEGKRYEVGPGDCVATGMGFHHDLPVIHEPIRAVFFETTLEGQKRLGHLWNHTHGPAQPRAERV